MACVLTPRDRFERAVAWTTYSRTHSHTSTNSLSENWHVRVVRPVGVLFSKKIRDRTHLATTASRANRQRDYELKERTGTKILNKIIICFTCLRGG